MEGRTGTESTKKMQPVFDPEEPNVEACQSLTLRGSVMSAPLPTAQQQHWIEQCQGLVRSLAVRIHRKLPARIELDDLIAYGELGLLEAAQSFDARRGCQFSTFAYYRIRGAIYDGAAKMGWGVSLSQPLQDDAGAASRCLEDRSQTVPSAAVVK
jgi:DNA-directed RNA polymerase specialized sigma subunit